MTARAAINKAGGLVNAGDLARTWNLSRARISEIVHTPGFPEPVATVGDRPVWLAKEAQEWRNRKDKTR